MNILWPPGHIYRARKFNVNKTFRRCFGHLLNISSTFLCSRGSFNKYREKIIIFPYIGGTANEGVNNWIYQHIKKWMNSLPNANKSGDNCDSVHIYWLSLQRKTLFFIQKYLMVPSKHFLFKTNNRNPWKRFIFILATKTPEWCPWRRSGVFIINFEHISHCFH